MTNSGGQRLDDTLTSKSWLPYTIDRTSGSLRGGQSDTITVTGIAIGGTITVSDAGGDTQQITVACW
ncbi:MAG: hypothetical protein H0X24_04305 [Ktedonobacterales bacterium]|nr:hypothetical protein [Ktedonobacterales bacterium]